MRLLLWHSAGSIEAGARLERDRRLAIAWSVLACLALMAVGFYLLYRRARNLRDREHEFVATVTHELRTPVAGVNAVAENLAEGIVVDPPRVREYGQVILDHGRRLWDLIDQVLLYAGLSKSTRRNGAEPIDVDALVRAASARVMSLPRGRLVVHVQPGLPPWGGDAAAVETIVTNLLSNAAKHAGPSATVTLSVNRQPRGTRSWLLIRVSDTGPGIPRHELGRVLQPFYGGEASRVAQSPGSGLGLSLVSRVVRTYGGNLSVESAVGSGTTVMARLPFEERMPR